MQETREFHDDTMKTKQLLNNSEDQIILAGIEEDLS
jgi:hypothetical protein